MVEVLWQGIIKLLGAAAVNYIGQPRRCGRIDWLELQGLGSCTLPMHALIAHDLKIFGLPPQTLA